MCALLSFQCSPVIVAEHISNDENTLAQIMRETGLATIDIAIGAAIKFYAEAFFLQEIGARVALRNETLKEQIDCTVPCLRHMSSSSPDEVPLTKKWVFRVKPDEFFIAEGLIANGAARNTAGLVRWVLSYFQFVLNNGALTPGWDYGVLNGSEFIPLVIPKGD